jgi:hypothetical protein
MQPPPYCSRRDPRSRLDTRALHPFSIATWRCPPWNRSRVGMAGAGAGVSKLRAFGRRSSVFRVSAPDSEIPKWSVEAAIRNEERAEQKVQEEPAADMRGATAGSGGAAALSGQGRPSDAAAAAEKAPTIDPDERAAAAATSTAPATKQDKKATPFLRARGRFDDRKIIAGREFKGRRRIKLGKSPQTAAGNAAGGCVPGMVTNPLLVAIDRGEIDGGDDDNGGGDAKQTKLGME